VLAAIYKGLIGAFFGCDLPLQGGQADPEPLLMEKSMTETDNTFVAAAIFA
jgi:hypothetical protein